MKSNSHVNKNYSKIECEHYERYHNLNILNSLVKARDFVYKILGIKQTSILVKYYLKDCVRLRYDFFINEKLMT